MAVFAVYIEKKDMYFGQERNFGNVYHYRTVPGQVFPDAQVAQEVHDAEQLITISDVDFVGWTTWGPTDGSSFDNVIRESGTFGDTGSAINDTEIYREACALIVWPISRSPVTNRARWLRKFIRCPGSTASVLPTSAKSGRSAVPAAILEAWRQYAADVSRVAGPGTDDLELVTETGDGVAEAGGGFPREFVYTRQIGQ